MIMLCIDDDPTILTVVEKIMRDVEQPGDEVLTAASAEEGLKILEQRPVDIMFIDLVLPGMHGIDLLKKVRSSHPLIEAIVLTGHASVDTAIEALRCGARDYLAKPLHLGVLKEKLLIVRDNVRERREVEEYRYAKEAVEESARRSIASFEEAMGMIKGCRAEVRHIVDSDDDDATKIVRIRKVLDSEQKDWC